LLGNRKEWGTLKDTFNGEIQPQQRTATERNFNITAVS